MSVIFSKYKSRSIKHPDVTESVIFSKYKSRSIKHPDGPESVILLQYESFQVTPTGWKRLSVSFLSIKPLSPDKCPSTSSCLSWYGSAYAGSNG